MKKRLFLSAMLMVSVLGQAQVSKIVGTWTTIDDKTQEAKSRVEIYQGSDGLYYGKITELFHQPADVVCIPCEGEDHNAPVVGLNIIRGMKADGEILSGGRVLDPENGKTYYAKLSLKDGKLILRGSLDKRGILGRSQTWIK